MTSACVKVIWGMAVLEPAERVKIGLGLGPLFVQSDLVCVYCQLTQERGHD